MTEDGETGEPADPESNGSWEQFVANHEEEFEEFRERQQDASSEHRMEISETIVDQHDDVLIDVSPDVFDDMIIRRYLSIPQFLSVMEGERLWFNSALNFEDDFEGALPKTNAQERRLAAKFNEETIKRAFGEWATDEIPGVDGTKRKDEIHLRHCLLNCWRMGDGPDQYTESALFWNAYIPDGEGVAIESTVGQLKQQLIEQGKQLKNLRNRSAAPGFHPGVFTGAVRYIDFHNDWAVRLLPSRLFFKRDKFSEEREFRAVVDTFDHNHFLELEECESEDFEYKYPSGDYVDIDRRELINEIIIAPDAPSHLYQSIENLIQKYDGFNASDVKSSMLDREEPIY